MPNIDEKKLTKGQLRKLISLRKSVGDKLGNDVFLKWLVQQAKQNSAPKPDPVAEKIQAALESAGLVNDRSFRLGNYGYTIRKARGKGASGIVASKNKG